MGTLCVLLSSLYVKLTVVPSGYIVCIACWFKSKTDSCAEVGTLYIFIGGLQMRPVTAVLEGLFFPVTSKMLYSASCNYVNTWCSDSLPNHGISRTL